MGGGGEVGCVGDWRFRSGLLTGGTVLLMRARGRLGVGVTTLFLAFTSLFKSGIGLFSSLPPPTFWPEIN